MGPINNKIVQQCKNHFVSLNITENGNGPSDYTKDLEQQLFALKERLQMAENKVVSQQATIASLKDENNFYFAQCLNPNCNLQPHPDHVDALKSSSITIYNDNGRYYIKL